MEKYFLICILLLAPVLATSRSLLSDDSDYDKSNAPWIHNLKRTTLNGKSVAASLFVTSGGDYFSSIAGSGIFCIGIAVVSVIAGIGFCIGRFAANKCGGKEADGDYTTGSNRAILIGVFVGSLAILGMIAAGIAGNAQFQPAMTDFFDHVNTEAAKQKTAIESIEPVLMDISPNRTSIRGYVAALNREGQITVDNAANGKNTIAGNNQWRLAMLGLNYGVSGVVIILTILGIVLRLPRLTLAGGLLSFFALFLCWINIAVHFPFSMFVSDLCYDISEYTIDQRLLDRINSLGEYGGLGGLLNCPKWSNANSTLFWTMELRETLIAQQRNETDPSTLATLNYNIQRLNITEESTLYVRDCEWLKEVLEPYKSQACGSYLSGLVLVWASAFVLFSVMAMYTVLSIMSHKRFSKSGFA